MSHYIAASKFLTILVCKLDGTKVTHVASIQEGIIASFRIAPLRTDTDSTMYDACSIALAAFAIKAIYSEIFASFSNVIRLHF